MDFPKTASLATVLIGSLVFGGGAAMAQPAPPLPRLMTDRADYCAHLYNEMMNLERARPSASPDARALADEGVRMCDRGHYRGGVARLRRALVLLRDGH